MTVVEGDATNKQSDEEPRLVSQQEVDTSVDDDVAARIKHEPARVEPEEVAESGGVISS